MNPAGKTQSEVRYVDSPEYAATYGYHAPDDEDDSASDPPMGPAEGMVLFGTDGENTSAQAQNGMAIPKGGCYGEVDNQLAERGAIVQDDDLVIRINSEGMNRSLDDPRLKAAFTSWSACMNERGHVYATPLEASEDPRWSAGPTAGPEEINTAVADVECMTKNNVVGVWFAVESAYQKQQIEANFEKLEDIRRAIDTSIRVANEVAAAG